MNHVIVARHSGGVGLLAAFLCITAGASSQAAVLHVPSPFPTIQAAIDAAASGDTIVVHDGTYSGPGNVNVTWFNKSLSLHSEHNDPLTCVVNCGGEDWIELRRTVGMPTCAVTISGIAVTHADTAVFMPRPSSYAAPELVLNISDCQISNGNAGIVVDWGHVTASRLVASSNAVVAVRTLYTCELDMRDCTLRNNGIGVAASDDFGRRVSLAGCDIIANGHGVRVDRDNRSTTQVSHCRVDSSTVGSGISVSFWAPNLRIDDCSISANRQYGIRYSGEMGGIATVTNSAICNNGIHGIAFVYLASAILDSVMVNGNGACGIADYLGSAGYDAEFDRHAGQVAETTIRVAPGSFRITAGEVRRNIQGGIEIVAPIDTVQISESVIADNHGVGLHVVPDVQTVLLALAGTTIAGNMESGIVTSASQWSMARTLVAFCGGPAVDLLLGSAPTVSCTDLFANAGGDWTAAIADQLGSNGNQRVDPRFCDAADGDYHLQVGSPLVGESSGACGTIGGLGVGCPAQYMMPFAPVCADFPCDQGGVLNVSWGRHAADAVSIPGSVTTYEVQRFESGWSTVASVVAAVADTYAVAVATPDVLTRGQPVPFSRYRVLARTAVPGVFYESPVDSGYSIDNLPPPKPAAMLVDAPDYRYIFWTSPEIADFANACVFRGEQPGFTPGEPLNCPSNGFFAETHLAWYFYRVQFSDIHGNLSEYSDELHGQFPTDVSGALPTVLRLYPCRPNPFNPRTTIKYDLPASGPVRLAVFDLAGRLVRTLVDEGMPQGSHEAVWDGRDATGREMGSGTYLARLEFGGKVEVVRMGLVR